MTYLQVRTVRSREAVHLAQGHSVTLEDPRVDPRFSLHSLASFSALQECLSPINYEFKTQQDVGFGKCRRKKERERKRKVREK